MEIFIVLKIQVWEACRKCLCYYRKRKKIHRCFQTQFLPALASTRILRIQNYSKKIHFPTWFIFSIFNCFGGFGGCMKEDRPESWKEPSPHTCALFFSIISPHKVAYFVSLLSHAGSTQLKSEVMRLVLKQWAYAISFVSILWNMTSTWRVKLWKKMANNAHI